MPGLPAGSRGGELTPLQVFLNIVLDDAIEEKPNGDRVRIGMVVIRGNSVVMLEVRASFYSPTS